VVEIASRLSFLLDFYVRGLTSSGSLETPQHQYSCSCFLLLFLAPVELANNNEHFKKLGKSLPHGSRFEPKLSQDCKIYDTRKICAIAR
jgi:hypothetical protein